MRPPDAELHRLDALAHDLGMDVLVESHDGARLARLAAAHPP